MILIRLVKNSIDPTAERHQVSLMRGHDWEISDIILDLPSPVMSMSPYFDLVPYNPPNEKGSLGTGIPMLTPSI